MKKSAKKSPTQEDISNSKKDEEQLRPDEADMDLPDVEDIPGQENIRPPKLKSYSDVTISSDDEEGKNIPGFDGDEVVRGVSDVSPEESDLLEQSVDSMSTQDDINQRRAMLDNSDEEGDMLNEGEDVSGRDLDIPGAEEDDEDEDRGEEDEENNSYSLGGDKD